MANEKVSFVSNFSAQEKWLNKIIIGFVIMTL